MPVIQIASSAVNAKLIGADRKAKLAISDALSYVVNGSDYSGWDGRSSFFIHKTSMFPAGFVPLVASRLKREGYEVQHIRKTLPKPLGPEKPVVDAFPEDPRYDYQLKTVTALLKYGQMIAQVATGGGKCLGKDTPVMLFDGSIKMSQDIRTGDQLMGPDSNPRNVTSITAGVGELYRVTPIKGDPYVVNDAHILSLKTTSRGYRGRDRKGEKYPKGEIVNINVEKYLATTKTFKHTHKGWRAKVDFEPTGKPLPVNPYLLGVILGDGSVSGTVSVTTMDPEITDMLEDQARLWGLKTNAVTKEGNAASSIYLTAGRTGGKVNPLMAALRSLGFVSEKGRVVSKFIPHAYKTASVEDRLEILAGMIDTDGYYDGKGLYLIQKNERLMDDFIFIARSLGFGCYKSKVTKVCINNGVKGTYFSTSLSGPLDIVPTRLKRREAKPRLQKKDPLVTGISVKSIGSGQYFGFEIDGDHLFLLGDFTVTHNTRIAKLATARIDRPTLFLTTRGILMHQMKEAYEEMGYGVGVLGDKQWTPRRRVNVGMVQTLASRLELKTEEGEVERHFANLAEREKRELDKLKIKLTKEKVRAKDKIEAIKKLRQRLADKRIPVEILAPKIEEKVARHNIVRLKTIKLMERFEFVILEEAHEAGSDSFYQIMRYAKNAHYRLSLTATPFMKDDAESNMRLMACSGPIGIRISEKLLIGRGILAQPIFKYIVTKKPVNLLRSTSWARAYKLGVIEAVDRNTHTVNEVLEAVSYGLTSMVLVHRGEHGKTLKAMFAKAGLRADFINGEHAQARRKDALAKLKANNIDVLIGSTILDVGVDVPAVGLVVIAGGYKAEVALRQRIGRGLREKKTGPNFCMIVDFVDGFNKHLKEHADQRRSIVESTPGFAENILPPETDFPYEKLGFVKKIAA